MAAKKIKSKPGKKAASMTTPKTPTSTKAGADLQKNVK
jgi:hypothetical protein